MESPALSPARGSASIKERIPLDLMGNSFSFWEVSEAFHCFRPHKCPFKIKSLCHESRHPLGAAVACSISLMRKGGGGGGLDLFSMAAV